MIADHSRLPACSMRRAVAVFVESNLAAHIWCNSSHLLKNVIEVKAVLLAQKCG
jgi:hypothetical protein